MKNLFTVILLLLVVNVLQAQYFQQRFNLDYGTPKYRDERCNSGIVTRDNYAGGNPALHYFASIGTSYNNAALPAPDNVADRMRFIQLNNVGTAVISDAGYEFSSAAGGPSFHAYGNSIAEIKNLHNNGGYVTVGEVKNNSIAGAGGIAGGSDALFTRLNAAGGVVNTVRYDVAGGSERAWCIRKSVITAGGQPTWLICGESKQTKTNTVCFVARVLVNGGIVWFNSYSFDPSGGAFSSSINIAKQLCEDPAGYIYVVGTVQDVPAAATGVDGLAFKLTAAGAVIWANSYHAATDDEYQAVRLAADGNIIVGGFTNFMAVAPVTHHMLITKLASPNGAIIFQNVLRAQKGAKTYTSKCYDIIETAGPQYFLAGPVIIGKVTYEMMYKANAAGAGINWYVYNTMKFDVGFGLDDSNVGAWTGVAYFSSMRDPDTTAFSDSHIMKTDYLGRSCNFCGSYLPANTQVNQEVHQLNHLPRQDALVHKLVAKVFAYNNKIICNVPAIACKDPLAPDQQVTEATAITDEGTVKMSPNPVSSILHIQFNNMEAGQYSITVVNRNGNVMMQRNNIYNNGSSVVDLNVSALSKGFYLVKVNNGKKVSEGKVFKE